MWPSTIPVDPGVLPFPIFLRYMAEVSVRDGAQVLGRYVNGTVMNDR